MSELPPMDQDFGALSPQDWDAVRRLRGEGAAEPEWPAAEPPASTGEPLPPVAPPPPPHETEPPVQQAPPEPAQPEPAQPEPVQSTAPAPSPAQSPSPTMQPPVWGGAPGRERSAGPAVPAMTALVVLAVVAAVLAALVGLRVSDRHTRDGAATAALSAATSGVATVLSYNYRSLDHDFAAAEALLTPAFRKAYVATTAKAVQPLAAKYQAVSTAQVSAAGVISASSSRATVLVFVSQQVTNSQLSAPRLDRSRIQVELVRTHGVWLINKLSPL